MVGHPAQRRVYAPRRSPTVQRIPDVPAAPVRQVRVDFLGRLLADVVEHEPRDVRTLMGSDDSAAVRLAPELAVDPTTRS